MNEGDIVLAIMAQAHGLPKLRPALFLKRMPPFDDLLVCGVSTQLRQMVKSFDELIQPGDFDFHSSGLKAPSIIRLGFLAVIARTHVKGRIGEIAPDRRERLLNNLADYLRP